MRVIDSPRDDHCREATVDYHPICAKSDFTIKSKFQKPKTSKNLNHH